MCLLKDVARSNTSLQMEGSTRMFKSLYICICIVDTEHLEFRALQVNGKLELTISSDGCRGTLNRVTYLEHVQAYITLSASNRGQIQIFLTSPLGTRSTLLPRREKDTSSEGFSNWAFMTTHCWGETSVGIWRLEIMNGKSICEF